MIAALCKTFEKVSYFLLGFLGGYSLSMYLLVMLSFKGSDLAYYSIKYGSAVLLGLICLGIQKLSLAFVTAIIGGFLVSYFSGFALNLLRNLGDIIERFKAGEKLEVVDYVFFGLFVVFSLVGMTVQMKAIKRE